ncbi:MAG: PIN domain nuclease [Mycobacteriales bacterium]
MERWGRVIAEYVADKSAWARLDKPSVAAALVPLIDRGVVGTCGVIDLEILYSARNGIEHMQMRTERRYSLPRLAMDDHVWDRAIEIQGELASEGRHRACSVVDLLVAVTAERHKVTILHYDHDYDIISSVTRQKTQWIVPAGSAD